MLFWTYTLDWLSHIFLVFVAPEGESVTDIILSVTLHLIILFTHAYHFVHIYNGTMELPQFG